MVFKPSFRRVLSKKQIAHLSRTPSVGHTFLLNKKPKILKILIWLKTQKEPAHPLIHPKGKAQGHLHGMRLLEPAYCWMWYMRSPPFTYSITRSTGDPGRGDSKEQSQPSGISWALDGEQVIAEIYDPNPQDSMIGQVP